MPKSEKVRLKNRRNKTSRRGSTPALHDTAPRMTTIERIFEFSRVAEDANSSAAYHAIIGREGSITDLSVANVARMAQVKDALHSSLFRRISQSEEEWAVRVARIGVEPGSKVDVDIPRCRKEMRPYTKAGVDAIMMTVVAPVPLPSDPTGFGIAFEARAIIFGSGARAAIQRAETTGRTRSGSPNRSSIAWYSPQDEEALKQALEDMFCPSWIKAPPTEGLPEEEASANWGKTRCRQLRGLVTLMTRSMLPAKKALALVGEGKAMVVGAIAAAEVGMKKASRASPPPVRPDGLPHFWFGEIRRLGLDEISVPQINLR